MSSSRICALRIIFMMAMPDRMMRAPEILESHHRFVSVTCMPEATPVQESSSCISSLSQLCPARARKGGSWRPT